MSYILAPHNINELVELIEKHYNISVNPDEINENDIHNLEYLLDLKLRERKRKTSFKTILNPGKADEFCKLLKTYKGVIRNPDEFKDGVTPTEYQQFWDLRMTDSLYKTIERLSKKSDFDL